MTKCAELRWQSTRQTRSRPKEDVWVNGYQQTKHNKKGVEKYTSGCWIKKLLTTLYTLTYIILTVPAYMSSKWATPWNLFAGELRDKRQQLSLEKASAFKIWRTQTLDPKKNLKRQIGTVHAKAYCTNREMKKDGMDAESFDKIVWNGV